MIIHCNKSLVGKSHIQRGIVCQDSSDVITLENGWIVAAIADGLGSAKHSELGSMIAVKTVLNFVKENVPEQWDDKSMEALLLLSFHKALKEIKEYNKDYNYDLSSYDTTLTVAIYNGSTISYGHVGDGGIVTLSDLGDYNVLTKTQKGHAANETYPLSSGVRHWTFATSSDNIVSFSMMTDGVFDEAVPWLLSKQKQKVYINFLRTFMDVNYNKLKPEEEYKKYNSDKLQEYAEKFLNSVKCGTITDDKTIVSVINLERVPRVKPDEYYAEPDWDALYNEVKKMIYPRAGEISADFTTDDDEPTKPADPKPVDPKPDTSKVDMTKEDEPNEDGPNEDGPNEDGPNEDGPSACVPNAEANPKNKLRIRFFKFLKKILKV